MSIPPDVLELAISRAVLAERERCANLIEQGFSRVSAERWRDDGKPSKNDLCAHKRYMYEDCELCAAIAIREGQQ